MLSSCNQVYPDNEEIRRSFFNYLSILKQHFYTVKLQIVLCMALINVQKYLYRDMYVMITKFIKYSVGFHTKKDCRSMTKSAGFYVVNFP